MKSFKYSGQEKKEVNPRQIWREEQKLSRDKGKHNWRCSRTRWIKHFGARSHRALERKAMKNNRFDDLHRLTYKEAFDPWAWD